MKVFKRLYFVLVLLCCNWGINAQVISLDSLQKLSYSDPILAIERAKEVVGYHKTNSDSINLAKTQNLLGAIFRTVNKLDSALFYHQQSILIYSSLNNYQGIAFNLANMATIYDIKGNYEGSIQNWTLARQYFKDAGDISSYYKTYINISNSYIRQDKYKEALSVLEPVANKLPNTMDSRSLAALWGNLATSYLGVKNISKALHYIEKIEALPIYNTDFFSQATTTRLRGSIYALNNEYERAEKNFLKALESANKVFWNQLIIVIYNNLIELKVNQGKSAEALSYATTLIHFNDSINAELNSQRLDEIARSVDFISLKNETILAKQKEKIAQDDLHSTTLWMLYISIALVIATLSLFFAYSRYHKIKRLNEQITLQKQQIELQNEQFTQLNMSLESRILERTKTLEIANDKLKDYAFFNSHKLRTPVANILGLKSVFELAKTEEEKKKIIELISISVEELDQLVLDIQKLVKD
ncbi:MAG: hypothetical protein ACXITV_07005 [Luteibaculaceae bacterium]